MLIKGLSIEIHGKLILSGINLSFVKGLNVILGPNGSGKTTLLRAVIGMIRPIEGGVSLDDEEMGYSPAEFFPAPMRVIDVMRSGTRIQDSVYLSYLQELGMHEYMDREFSSLSSGEKRMVLVAKALAEGNVILMDEPLSNLDARNYVRLVKTMKRFSKAKTIVSTSHDVELGTIADRVVLMKEGKVFAEGEPSSVLSEKTLSELYGVKMRRVNVGERIIFVKDISDI